MTRIFDFDGENLDRGFYNLRAAASPVERELHNLIESMWEAYEPYADPDFRDGFARDVDGRFWEMFLGCTLLEAGRTLLPARDRRRAGGQPDLCVVEDGRRIWIEAVTPREGDPGPDQVVPPVPINEGGGLNVAPVRQAELRVTSAFSKKARKIGCYMQEGVIGADDVRIIAISGGRFGTYVGEHPLPLIMTCLFPLGDASESLAKNHANKDTIVPTMDKECAKDAHTNDRAYGSSLEPMLPNNGGAPIYSALPPDKLGFIMDVEHTSDLAESLTYVNSTQGYSKSGEACSTTWFSGSSM